MLSRLALLATANLKPNEHIYIPSLSCPPLSPPLSSTSFLALLLLREIERQRERNREERKSCCCCNVTHSIRRTLQHAAGKYIFPEKLLLLPLFSSYFLVFTSPPPLCSLPAYLQPKNLALWIIFFFLTKRCRRYRTPYQSGTAPVPFFYPYNLFYYFSSLLYFFCCLYLAIYLPIYPLKC